MLPLIGIRLYSEVCAISLHSLLSPEAFFSLPARSVSRSGYIANVTLSCISTSQLVTYETISQKRIEWHGLVDDSCMRTVQIITWNTPGKTSDSV